MWVLAAAIALTRPGCLLPLAYQVRFAEASIAIWCADRKLREGLAPKQCNRRFIGHTMNVSVAIIARLRFRTLYAVTQWQD